MKQLISALLACLALTTQANASTLTVNPKRLIEVIDVIDGGVLEGARQLDKLSSESKAPVYILLNSPGGETIPGYSFADAMIAAHERGTRLVCVTGVLAASMAFNLLAYCDERYALPHAKLLFHPVRISAREGITVADMETLTPQMKRLEAANKAALIEMMGAKREWFDLHYAAETLWEAQDLVNQTNDGWLTIISDVRGVDKLFTIQKPRPMFLFQVPGLGGNNLNQRPTPRY